MGRISSTAAADTYPQQQQPHLPRQYQQHYSVPIAPQHHRSSEGALSTNGIRRPPITGDPSNSLKASTNSLRFSLDTRDEYICLRESRPSPRIWTSYLFVLLSILFTLSIVLGIGLYLSSMTSNAKMIRRLKEEGGWDFEGGADANGVDALLLEKVLGVDVNGQSPEERLVLLQYEKEAVGGADPVVETRTNSLAALFDIAPQ